MGGRVYQLRIPTTRYEQLLATSVSPTRRPRREPEPSSSSGAGWWRNGRRNPELPALPAAEPRIWWSQQQPPSGDDGRYGRWHAEPHDGLLLAQPTQPCRLCRSWSYTPVKQLNPPKPIFGSATCLRNAMYILENKINLFKKK